VIYTIALTICYAFILITFPGYPSTRYITSKYDDWYHRRYKPITKVIEAVWITFFAVSLFLTTYSIIKLIAMLKIVVKTNRQLQVNKFQLVAHCLVLASEMTGVVISSYCFNKSSEKLAFTASIIYLAVIDSVAQLLICRICWQYAVASKELVDSEMVVRHNKNGLITINFVNRFGSDSSKGIGSVYSLSSFNPSSLTESEGVITAECDEIVAQFLTKASEEWSETRTKS